MYKRKSFVIPVLVALLLSFLFVATTSAQDPDDAISLSAVSPPPQTSFALIQNLSDDTATVGIEFWTENDTTGDPIVETSQTIEPNSAINVNPTQFDELPSGWRGSMVVQSNQPIVATVVNYGATTAHSIYEGFDDEKASEVMLLPSVHWNPAGQESLIAVQNVEDSAVDVEITYFDKDGVAVKGPDTYTINPSVSLFRNAIEDCAACPGGPNGASGVPEGSARVETVNSGDKVAVTVIEYVGSTAYAYDGIKDTSAGREFLLPSIHHNPAGQFSFSLVQNTSTTDGTDVTIDYKDPSGAVVDSFTVNVPASGSFNFITVPGAAPEDPTNMPNEGSATVSSADTDVVVSVVETASGFPYSYNGFRVDDGDSAASSSLLFPSVHRNLGGQFSFLLVANPDGSTAADCEITFTDNATQATDTFSKQISANGSYNFITVPDQIAEDPTSLGNEGSASLACSSGAVVGVVVETVFNVPGVYEAFGN